jgi:hypothetical protein
MQNKRKHKIHNASQAVAKEKMHRTASEVYSAMTGSCDGLW